jgi:hypothetical protein
MVKCKTMKRDYEFNETLKNSTPFELIFANQRSTTKDNQF